MNEKIGVIGLWHLGCVISASWVKMGHSVVGFDYDEDRVNKLNKIIAPIFEPFLEDEIELGIKKKLLQFSNKIDSLSDCDFIFLSYDTPVGSDDSCDTSILLKSVEDVKKIMKDNSILIISSQSPVGFSAYLRELLKKTNENLELAYSPENLRLGEAIECYLNPGRIILGAATNETKNKCIQLFVKITQNIITMSLESSELVKHGINSFLATSVVFANGLADICEIKNADIDEVIKGVKSDPRIGHKAYLSPGIGFSGGTLGRDLKVLDELNFNNSGFAKIFGFIHSSNNERKAAIFSKVDKIIGGVSEKKICILGLTYKPGTSTLRRSLPLEIVELFISNGAIVTAYDPKADYSEVNMNPKLMIKNNIESAVDMADLLLLLTDWQEFKDYDWSKIQTKVKGNLFFDAKNCLSKNKMNKYGYDYYSLGRM